MFIEPLEQRQLLSVVGWEPQPVAEQAAFAGLTLYVDDNAPGDPGPGNYAISDPLEDGSDVHPFDAIQEAIDVAADGDIVIVLDGTYTGTGNRDIDFGGRAITVRSQNGPDNCIVDCQGSEADPHRGFYFQSAEGENSILDGFTITNGHAAGGNWPQSFGGGICLQSASPTIRNNTIVGNAAFDGGGLYYEGDGIIENNTIVNNSALRFGGGISCDWGAPTIKNNTIAGNTAEYGAGLFTRGTSTITGNTITGNTAQYMGGGILSWEDNPPIITNNLIVQNSAGQSGGGIAIHETGGTITNNTIVGNAAATGGGIWNDGSPPVTIITNCILWANGDDLWGCSATYSCIEDNDPGAGNIHGDPLFVHPATRDYRLLLNSPCIDMGDNGGVPPWLLTDLDGNPRLAGSAVDMGAYEFQELGILYVDADATGDNDGTNWADAFTDLQDALSTAAANPEVWEIRVAEGVYTPAELGNRQTSFQLVSSVALRGGYAGAGEPDPNARDIDAFETILSGDLSSDDGPEFANYDENSYHVVTTSQAEETAVLDGFVVTAGNAQGADFDEDKGAGMLNVDGSPVVTNCTFRENLAGWGAGMSSWGGQPMVFNCTFRDNVAGYHAGGLMIAEGMDTLPVANCTFSGNSAGWNGGAVWNFDCSPSYVNCLFTGNTAGQDGGAIWNVDDGGYPLINCTLTNNTAGGRGGAIDSDSWPTLESCIFWDNRDSTGAGESAVVHSYNGTPTANYSCVQGWTGTWSGVGNHGDDPLFVDIDGPDDVAGTEDDNLRLLPGSPCIDAADNTAVPNSIVVDLAGDPRFVDDPNTPDTGSGTPPIVDMGAYEFQTTQVLYVDVDAVGNHDGTTWTDAFTDLQDALSAAAADGAVEEIRVAAGVYTPAGPGGDRTATFQLISAVSIYGGFAGGETSLDQRDPVANKTSLSGDLGADDVGGPYDPSKDDNCYHVVTGSGTDATAVLDGFTVTAGKAYGYGENHIGGGMVNVSGNPMLKQCTFTANWAADRAGGMYNIGSSPTLIDCTFSENTTGGGGGAGMHNRDGSNPVLTGCTFSGNYATSTGGGMYNYNSSPILTDCTFSGNAAGDQFGGSLIGGGGGMYNRQGSAPTLTNCLFSGNKTVNNIGAGMRNYGDASPTLINCTFSGNSSSNNYGGGIYSDAGNQTLVNCIFWGNTDREGAHEAAQIHGGTPVVSYSCIQGMDTLAGNGNIDGDPLMMDVDGPDDVIGTEDDNLRLWPGSPCADAGDDSAIVPSLLTDLDGDPRIAGAAVDIGAYEGPKQGFVLSTQSIIVPEGETATFTVALAIDPLGTVEVAVAVESGDPDVTVESGGSLTFDSANYSDPQVVTLAAAEDWDTITGSTLVQIGAAGLVAFGVTATEGDNEPHPNVLLVDGRAAGANNGSTWTDAFTDLQEALHFAATHVDIREIWVAQGQYRPAGPGGDRAAAFQLVDDVTIKGGYAGYGEGDPDARDVDFYETVLSGDLNGDDGPDFVGNGENSYHVVTGNPTDSMGATAEVLDGFTITGGNADGSSSPDNRGGGMYCNSDATVIDCTFIENFAAYGAGMYCGPTWCCVASPTLTNCTFAGNSAAQQGGGLWIGDSDPTLTDCTIRGNTAGLDGGGIMFGNDTASELVNCVISGNTAGNDGGGVHAVFTFNTSLNNCTFSGNSAANRGGGLFCQFDCYITLNNSIFWDNTDAGGTDESAQIDYQPNEAPTVNYSCVQGWTGSLAGTGSFGANPLLADADGPDDVFGTEDDDLRLLPGSACIDAGDNTAVPPSVVVDLDGNPRFVDDPNTPDTGSGTPPIVDMGAYEFQGSLVAYVDADATGNNDGTSWADAFTDLQDALATAAANPAIEEILVAQGVYTPAELGNRQTSFQLVSGVALRGGYAGFGEPDPDARDLVAFETILSGDLNGDDSDDGPQFAGNDENSYHVVSGNETDQTAVLDGFTIAGGNADGPEYEDRWGGGLLVSLEGSPTIVDCAFRENWADDRGGGVSVSSGRPALIGCTLTGNQSELGGGLGGNAGALTDCTFSQNTAWIGGGIWNGSVWNDPATWTNCVFLGNLSTYGGAGAFAINDVELVNCIFSGNSTDFSGGGMFAQDCDVTLTNCTFSRNAADTFGGFLNDEGLVTATNGIFWGNHAASGTTESAQFAAYDPPIINYSCIQGWTGDLGGTGNFGDDPMLVDADGADEYVGTADDDLRLLPDSPCIDAGDNTAVPPSVVVDLDGNLRIAGGTVDMGAYEFQGSYTFYVDDDAAGDPGHGDPSVSDPLEDGTPAHPFDAIQEAIHAASGGDTVIVLDGTYTGTGNRDVDFFCKALIVRSANGPENCTVDSQGSENEPHRGFYFHSGEGQDSVLEGFTITGGYGAGDWTTSFGGAVYSFSSSPTIRGNVITGNAASRGGGIYCADDTVVTENLIVGNTATDGGGVYCSGRATITHNTITDNTATQDGGGINCYEWNTVANNTISQNTADRGGGIWTWEDYPATIINNVISENWAETAGGGIGVSWDYTTVIAGNLIVNNATGGTGGAIYLASDSSLIINNTIAGNTAPTGGGIVNLYWEAAVTNSILWDNGDDLTGCTVTYSCIEDNDPGEGNIHSDPLFADPAAGDYRLPNGSPAINAGNDAAVAPSLVVDLDGNPRIVGSAVDMGAYEFVSGLPILVGDDWRYFKGTEAPPADWNQLGFDDSPWLIGPSGIGYGDGDDATVLSDMQGNYLSVYARRLFHVDDPAEVASLILTMDYDDGFAAYVNGVPVVYSNVSGVPPAFDTPATANHEAGAPEAFDVSAVIDQLVPGTNVLAVQGHNVSLGSSDFSLVPSLLAEPVIVYVDDDAPDDPGAGDPGASDPLEDGTAAHPFDAIQEAIAAAQDGQTVVILDGTYTGEGNLGIDFLGKAITVRSQNGPEDCIVDGQDVDRGFRFHSGEGEDSVLEGLTITGGHAYGSGQWPYYLGGAISCEQSSPTITGCVLVDNWAYRGGGISLWDSNAVITGCTIQGNLAHEWGNFGGGIYLEGSAATIADCLITENEAGNGGGIASDYDSTPTIIGCTVLDNLAHNNGGGIYCYDDAATIVDSTITGNVAEYSGGGFYCEEISNPTLINCAITGNRADVYLGRGGGIYSGWNCHVTVINCTTSGNVAINGGGLYCDLSTTATVTGSTFADNSATHGGGVYSHSNDALLTGCTLERNSAEYEGAGMYSDGASLLLTDCTFLANTGLSYHDAPGAGLYIYGGEATLLACKFLGNSGSYGAGLRTAGGSTLVVNSLFSGNTVHEGGGAISNGSNLTLVNSTITGNSCDWYNAGGIQNYGDTLTVINSILWGNSLNGDFSETSQIDGGSPSISYTCVQGWTGQLGGVGNFGQDPMFVDADGTDDTFGTPDDNVRLLPGSPCINAGDNAAVPPWVTTDLDGNSRIFGGTVDMGAYELELIAPLPIVIGDDWRYFKGTEAPPADWNQLGFDDSPWLIGPSGIGYGDGDDATLLSDMQGNYLSVYARRLFHVDDPAELGSLILTMDYDDGFAAYVNGVAVVHSNVSGDPPAFDTPATANHEAGAPEAFDVSAIIDQLVPGTNVLAVQGHNVSLGSSDFSLIPSLYSTPIDSLVVTSLDPSESGFTARFNRPIDPSVLNLYDTAHAGLGPADATLVGQASGPIVGSLVVGDDQVTFIATGGPLPEDSYTVTLRSATDGFRDPGAGILLDGNSDGTAGDDFVGSFDVAPLPPVVVGVPDFSRGPGQPVDVPATSVGLPVRISDAAGVETVEVTLVYDPALLTVTGVTLGPEMPPGSLIDVNLATPGTAIVGVASATPLGPGQIEVITLAAEVPPDAGYGLAHVLDLTDVELNEGSIAAVADDALHVAAYFGDTTATGSYSALDAQRTIRVALGHDEGFAQYPLVDPVVLADITGDGAISMLDAKWILQEAIGKDRPEIPPLPEEPDGIDPPMEGQPPAEPFYVNISADLMGAPGQIVTVPINIDDAESIESFDMAIAYDPAMLTFSEARLQGLNYDDPTWEINDEEPGVLRIGIADATPLVAGGGSVIEIDFAVAPLESPGQGVPIDLQAAQLNEGSLAVEPLPVPGADPTDGLMTIVAAADIVDRHVFYNHSAFDDDDAGANEHDDDAVATDKVALLPGEKATLQNYTSYSRGINGVMIDVNGLTVVPALEHFEFKVGNNDDPATWTDAPAPTTITLRGGFGTGESDRITIIWADYAIRNEWLQVKAESTGLGLAEDDVFYFGNAVGEAGNSAADAQVTTTDLLLARNNPRNFLDSAGVDFLYDFDRDKRVNSTDVLLARNNQTNFLSRLELIDLAVEESEMLALLAEDPTRPPPQADAAQADVAQADVAAEQLAWLYELEQSRRSQRPSEKSNPAAEAAQELLATCGL